jgi:hypothetical protein
MQPQVVAQAAEVLLAQQRVAQEIRHPHLRHKEIMVDRLLGVLFLLRLVAGVVVLAVQVAMLLLQMAAQVGLEHRHQLLELQ